MIYPEWGKSETTWTKYFLATKRETVEDVIRGRFGDLKKYCQYDRCEEVIEIEELKEMEFEEL